MVMIMESLENLNTKKIDTLLIHNPNNIMKNQYEILFDWFDKFCVKNDKYYLIDHNIYKKIMFHKYETEFLEEILPYYHLSKTFYVTRKFSYNFN